MADAQKKLIITAEFDNNTQQGFNQLQRDTDKLTKSSGNLNQSILSTTAGFVQANIIMAGARAAVDTLRKGFDLLLVTLEAGAQLQMTNTALEVIADNADISAEALKGMRMELAEINTFGQSATNVLKQFIQTGMYELVDSVQWASGEQGFEGYIETVKDFGAAMGVSSKKAIDDFTVAIASLQPEMLANYNITSDLNDVYRKWGEQHGIQGQLDETQKRLAVLNLVASEGADVAGVYNATYETTGKNLLSIADAATSVKEELGLSMQPLIEGGVGDILDLLQEFNKYVIENGETLKVFFENLSVMFNFVRTDVQNFKNEAENFDMVIIGLGEIAKGVALTASGFKVLAGTVRLFFETVKAMYAPVVAAIGAIASAVMLGSEGKWKEAAASLVEVPMEVAEDVSASWSDAFNDVSMDALDFTEIMEMDVKAAWEEAKAAAQGSAAATAEAGAAYHSYATSVQSDAKKVADALANFNERLRSMVIQHRDRLEDLKQQLKDLNAEIKKEIDEREKDAKVEEEAIIRSSQLKIKRLEQEIALEKERGSAASQERIDALQAAVAAEDALRKKRLGDLKSDLKAERKAIRAEHKDDYDELQQDIKAEQTIQKKYAWAFKKYKGAQEIDDITKLLQGFFAQYGFIPRAQAGLNSASGGLALVGERGAELVSLPRGAKVHSTEETKGMMGNTFNFYIGGVYGVDNLQRVIMETVNRSTSTQNNLARYNVL